MELTPVYDDYWRFAFKRQETYFNRLTKNIGPWTDDPIIANHRFTNAYRASDRVSQYLIKEVQYNPEYERDPIELFYRTILFKIFNKIETWELIKETVGVNSSSLDILHECLDYAFEEKTVIYCAAYIMPSPNFGNKRKHNNHIALIKYMMDTQLPQKLMTSNSLEESYNMILSYPGIGKFLAFQYAIDFNYSELTNFDENEFVVAGPGALDGIAKCFKDHDATPEEIISMMVEMQDEEFERLGLPFGGLFGRKLHLIDCQNLFCEISKYARVKHPDVQGVNGRTKIKQNYHYNPEPMPTPFFPPKWGINEKVLTTIRK